MQALKGQLTLRGVAIGCVGCAIITAASAYTALKMGALPWPIIFAAIISLFFLKALGRTNLNEANVTHTVMSAGAMVAGGLAFTIPGALAARERVEETRHHEARLVRRAPLRRGGPPMSPRAPRRRTAPAA